MAIINFLFTAILVLCTLFLLAKTEPVQDKRALLDFIDNIYHTRKTNWDEKTSACSSWTGITCNHDNSRIVAVRLPAVGFRGIIPPNTVTRLSALQILSLRSNGLSGPFPSDLLRLGNLMALYLEDNDFQGPLPSDFSGWKNISVLNFSNNNFNGSIPSSISKLTLLTVLSLANNSFSGEIPDIDIPSLRLLDLSNNNLTGALPGSLSRFPSSYFSGNNISSGNTSPPTGPIMLAPITPIKRSRISESIIIAIVIGTCVLAFVSIALLLIVTNRKKKEYHSTNEKKEKATKNKITVSENQDKNARLVFFEGYGLAFNLEDLLRASAEVLGKGSFGTAYKAALEDGTTVAVKRLREVIVGRREFEQQMEVVGSVRHENVAPLRAYYYSKDEKLMVYDYYDLGSVYALLHAKRGEKRVPLDWETRINIAIGAARGLAHIHSQTGGKLVHGNIKASNIFLDSKQHASISDLGLATLSNPITPPAMRSAGYRGPEVTDTRKVSQPSDVYSFGVVLLELLTGKSPVKTGNEEVVHLVKWVHSVVREEWTGEVFDVELLGYPDIEEEMMALLQIGMGCVARVPGQRPKIKEVVRMLEEIRGINTGNNSQSGGTRSPASTPSLTPYVGEVGSSSAS